MEIEKKSEENIIKSIRNLFKLKKEKKDKGRIRDIRTRFKQESDYYKPTRAGKFWNNNYIEYENTDDRNKNLSAKEYLDKINHT